MSDIRQRVLFLQGLPSLLWDLRGKKVRLLKTLQLIEVLSFFDPITVL